MSENNGEEEVKQMGYPLDPPAPERVEIFKIDDSSAENNEDDEAEPQEPFIKQIGVNWYILHTSTDQMVDSGTLGRI